MSSAILRWIGIVGAMGASLWACTGSEPQKTPNPAAAAGPVLPLVSDERTDLIFSWFGDGGAQIAASVAEVPGEARKAVRVQDPAIAPEHRDPTRVYVADLTAPGPDGKYPVRVVERAAYMARHQPKRPDPAVAAPSVPGARTPAGAGEVVMYSTRHCPVCVKARRWLLDNNIPYVEKDVERDQAAARELARKGQAQGFRPSGVPVFDVNGRLLPGFDPAALKALLSGAAAPAPKPI